MRLLTAPGSTKEVVVFQPSWLPPTEHQQRFPYRLVPLLSAILDAGYSVRFLEEARGDAPVPAWKSVLENAAAVVAWCGEMYPGHQIRGLLALIGLVRDLPGVSLAVGGGFFPLLDVAKLQLDPAIRCVVTGPGERVIPDVLRAFSGEIALADVEGVVEFAGGKAVSAGKLARPRPLAPRGMLALEQLDLEEYGHPEPRLFGNDLPSLQILAGSGCAKHCPFCFDERTPYRVFDPNTVVEAIRRVAGRTGIRQFLIGELDFFHNKNRALAIARGLAESKTPVRWFALGSVCDVHALDDAALDLLARSGCVRIELGSEAGSDAQLARLRKRHSVAHVEQIVARLEARGIATVQNLLFGAPGETEAERRATVRLALRIARLQRSARFNLRLYQIVPNTSYGESILKGREESFPNTLQGLLEYRQEAVGGGRCLPWLSPRDEEWVNELVHSVLPLALGEHFGPPPAAWRRTGAGLLARIGSRAAAASRWLARDTLKSVRVVDTYVA